MGSESEANNGGVFGEVQLLLAEKRTSLASLRTGIAVFALPLSVLSVLVATSKLYDVFHVLHFLLPLLILNAGLVILGGYLIIRSVAHIHRYERLIKELKRKYSSIAEFLD
ncbi:MAG TPA: hypothetical protein VLT36_13920 [Candidatus Dormibacteraeota bacterium]|nr:hypothetical protein [Candidatus Dormibacteraeota bacterium]